VVAKNLMFALPVPVQVKLVAGSVIEPWQSTLDVVDKENATVPVSGPAAVKSKQTALVPTVTV
jgi:hypothetical protein